MSIIFNSADIAETMNNGVSNVTGADSIITENYTNVVQHGIKIDMSVREKTLSGTPPLTFNSNGTPLLDFLISGNMVQSGTPTPDNPIQPNKCGDLETSGAKAGQYKIPISSANTTTSVYLGEVESTRWIKKLVLTGDENFDEIAAGLYRITENGYMRSADTLVGMCSHFGGGYAVAAAPSAKQDTLSFLVSASGNNYVYFSSSQYLTISDFKTYLQQQYSAGVPVTVWYVLAEPTTGIVNEPLCKIGDYADTLSMEQAGVTIPTAVGSNTINVDTTLKPSNISITYKGR